MSANIYKYLHISTSISESIAARHRVVSGYRGSAGPTSVLARPTFLVLPGLVRWKTFGLPAEHFSQPSA